MGKPALLLDIDGTLCPIGPGPPGQPMTWVSTGASGVRFRADLPALLGELARDFELIWATGWEDHANLLLAPPLGLAELPVIRFQDPAPHEVDLEYIGRTWKLPSVERWAQKRSLAWIDDDVHADAHAWAAQRPVRTKLLATDPAIGITDAQIVALRAFARQP